MPAWPQDPPWRQGHVIPDEVALRLEVVTAGANQLAFVVSHDCDLAAIIEVEPYVEVIVGTFIDVPDGNNLHTKNARRLHLPVMRNDMKVHVDLLATKKQQISKEHLAEIQPDAAVKLDPACLEQLQRWLAVRYRRAAFPNGFEARMKGRDINSRIAKLLRRHGQGILGLYFDVDDGNDFLKSGSDDVYELRIVIIYGGGANPERTKHDAEHACTEVSTVFSSRCQEDGQWKDIELVGCEAISADAISLSLFRQLREWRLEYISLAEAPTGDTATG